MDGLLRNRCFPYLPGDHRHAAESRRNGIIWPISVAPYHVIITEVKPGDEQQDAVSQKIYDELTNAGVEVLWDDRDERPGVKFKDADLIGIPVRITVGKRAGEGVVEYKLRRDADKSEKSAEEAVADTIAIVNAERTGRNYMK